ncbi:DUF4328 domain-containing protein [Rhodanobacter ginsengiterrae]|uniref:DUF4328 domain-containing protein n=1 Tax=Rhodanobacter ginsengiterrae TaxID=2008451 RepID=UPI003CF66B39
MSLENPYRAPLSVVADLGVPEADTFRSPQSLRHTVVGLVIASALASLLTIIVIAYLRQALQQAAGHEFVSQQAMLAELRRRGLLQTAMSSMQLLVLLATYIASGMWIYRVACNARALGAKGLDDSPGWAVGWYFVPFLSLQRPFRAMEQIWLASQSPLRWQKLPTPVLLRCWWALWLAMSFFGFFVYRITSENHTVTEMIGNESALIFSQLLGLAAKLCFLLVVMRLTRMQIEQHGRADLPPSLDIDMARLPSVNIG